MLGSLTPSTRSHSFAHKNVGALSGRRWAHVFALLRGQTSPSLGLRDFPTGLNDCGLWTFFSYSATELRCIRARHQPLHRLTMALHIGFIRMTGRTLDAIERIPKRLQSHIAEQNGVQAQELATVRSQRWPRLFRQFPGFAKWNSAGLMSG